VPKPTLVSAVLACAAVLSHLSIVRAQDQFGGQSRADAASRAIVLAVQQGISGLPPTSGQSFVYEFNPASSDIPVRSQRLAPISLRAPETVGEGSFSFRAAVSYFALSASLGPIDYQVDVPNNSSRFAKFGTKVDAKVGVFGLTLNYGITRRVEATFNLPMVLVDVQGSEIFSHDPSLGPKTVGFGFSPHDLNEKLANGTLVLRTVSFSQLGLTFNDGTHVGVGRMSLGTKARVYFEDPFRLAAACDFYFPSPSEAEFAGSDSPSILPRVIGSARLANWMRLHVDAGYDYDFDVSQLRRFVWDFGVSFPLTVATFDLGVGGSKYDTPIDWTPQRVRSSNILVTALGNNQTGTNYVDFLAGAKVRLSDTVILGGAVNVPVTNEGLQPIVGGTVALEIHL
jgi:hypothetical protein